MGEHIPRFKTLSAYYEQDGLALGGPHEICVNMRCGDIAYDVVVKQCRTREITTVAAEPIPWTNIQTPLFIIERLLMLFDGAFFHWSGQSSTARRMAMTARRRSDRF